MPFFHTYDGTELTYHLQGEGEPLICVPGGPMRAAVYLGDLGGLSAHRQLVLLDLRGTGESAVPDDPATYRRRVPTQDETEVRSSAGSRASTWRSLATSFIRVSPGPISRPWCSWARE